MTEENLATDKQIKKLYALVYNTGTTPKMFREERGFENYAKLSREECSAFIEELEKKEHSTEPSQPQKTVEEAAANANTAAKDGNGEGDGTKERVQAAFRIAKEVIFEEFGELQLNGPEMADCILRTALSVYIGADRKAKSY